VISGLLESWNPYQGRFRAVRYFCYRHPVHLEECLRNRNRTPGIQQFLFPFNSNIILLIVDHFCVWYDCLPVSLPVNYSFWCFLKQESSIEIFLDAYWEVISMGDDGRRSWGLWFHLRPRHCGIPRIAITM